MNDSVESEHPFGVQVKRYLRRSDLRQKELADETGIAESILSEMLSGKRLGGRGARERVVHIIDWFRKQNVIRSVQEADDLLAAAGMLPLDDHNQAEEALRNELLRLEVLVPPMGYQAVEHDKPLDPGAFGIDVAEFGEGPDFHITPDAETITDQIARQLAETVRSNPAWSHVAIARTGLIASEDEAQLRGQAAHAGLVIWGQVVRLGSGSVSIYFYLPQTLDGASSPPFPLVLPARTVLIRHSADAPLDTTAIKQLITRQSQAVTAFSLGLAAYFRRDYK